DIPVVAVDEIGNVITGLDNGSLENLAPSLELSGPAGSLLARKGDKFDDVQEGEAVFYKGSKGLVEVAVNMGNAAEGLGISGQEVELDGGNPSLSLRVSMRAGNASVRAA
ncbi:MAG TPA: hypothetical protein EYP90_02800, partial [Chromatiaceae bacterium]|nr:hypothetical protein [Chromatiaceae bacterium]